MASPGVIVQRPESTLHSYRLACRKRSLAAAFASPQGVMGTHSAATGASPPPLSGLAPVTKRGRAQHSLAASTASFALTNLSAAANQLFSSFPSPAAVNQPFTAPGRKRSSEQAWGVGAWGSLLLDDKGGFAGFAPDKRARHLSSSEDSVSGRLTPPANTNDHAAQNQGHACESAESKGQSPPAKAEKISSMSRSDSLGSSGSLNENNRPALHSLSLAGNKRLRQTDSDDEVMMCAHMRKRAHAQAQHDAELDKPVYSSRYVNQLKEHYEKKAKAQGHRIRREAAAEITANTAKTVQSTAKHASRIALENERLSHENHVLRCGMQTLSKRAEASDQRAQALERENNALRLRMIQLTRLSTTPQVFSPGHVF